MEIFKPTVVLILLVLCVLAFSSTAHCRVHHKHVPEFRAFPPTRQSLLDQNAEIDRLHLPRIKNDNELRELISNGDLVPIHATESLALSPLLPASRAYVRPWVLDMLSYIAPDFYATFHINLQINSAVRTVQVQRWLLRFDRNAAPWHGV